ncbi:hypothetical protein CFE70_007362 [Pyrenophora teres f. teres 0-1]
MTLVDMEQSQPIRNATQDKKRAAALRKLRPGRTVGTLERLPLELRQMIYEYVLKAGNPIKALRKNLGFIPSYRDPVRRYLEPSKERRIQKGRFSLLYVCKAMNKEAAWVLYNKVPLELEMTAMLAQYADIGVAWDTQTNFSKICMWLNAAQYRSIQLVVPSTDEPTSLADLIELLLSIVAQLLDCWDRLSETTNAVKNCKVSVQLSRLFVMKTHPSRITARPTERIRKALKKLARCIGKNKDVVKWTVTAMDDINPKKEQGRRMLKKLKRRLRDDGVNFVGLSKDVVPANMAYCHYRYVKAGQRSTHIRFDG